MRRENKTYPKYASERAEKSPIIRNCTFAFLVGGSICTLGQLLFDLYLKLGISQENVQTLMPVTLIFLSALATGLGLFGKLAKYAGAGTLVPITGFANSVVAPAIDNKAEGWILGLGAQVFVIAGPVILYGTLASVIYGLIYYCFQTF